MSFRLLAIVGLLYAAALALETLQLVVVPLLLALFVTAILHRPVEFLHRAHVPRVLSSALGACLFVLILAGTVLAAGLIVRGERSEIAESVREGWTTLEDWVQGQDGSIAGLAFEDLVAKIGEAINARSGEVAGAVAAGAAGVLIATTEIVLAAFLAFFMLRDGESIVDALLKRLPGSRAEQIGDIGSRMWGRVEGYLRGIALTAFLNSIFFGIALLIIGVPFVFPIMAVTFVGSFIPYAGPVFATLLAALVALGNGGGSAALWVIFAGFLVQQFEGYVLQPFVVGRAAKLHPLVVLVAVVAGATVAGIMGAFVAVPIAAAVAVLTEPSS